MYEHLIGKTVKITLTEPIATHFSRGTKTIYGTLTGERSHLIQVHVGYITEPDKHLSQEHIISKDLVKDIKQDWLDIVERGNKEWYKPTDAYIPARDEYRIKSKSSKPKRKVCKCKK